MLQIPKHLGCSHRLALPPLFFALCAISCPPAAFGEPASPPNIVFILADDLGYGELGCYGQTKIKTPNLDRLATQGVRLTNHYCGAPVCAPSRCTLMTGRHLGQAEIRSNRDSGNGRIFPGQWPITDQAVTIAELLKDAGYATGAFGKWGLGPSNTSGSPIKQGFDRFYGYNDQRNAHSFYPRFLDSDEKEVQINAYAIPGHDRKPEGPVVADDYRAKNYAPDLILNQALKFIRENRERPFFAYLPLTEPHVAMQPPQEWIDRYPESWDTEHGAYRGQNGYLPHPRPRAAYAAMISDLDEHVGKVMGVLDQLQLSENTLVVFTSDNGPTHGGRDPNFHIGGAACTFFESAGGLRGFKGSCYEGGIRVPCIMRFPSIIQAGSTCDIPSYFPDWMITLANAAGNAPINNEHDGIDLVQAVLNPDASMERPLIWDFMGYGGTAAIRQGKWKAIRRNLNRKSPTDWELYDLDSDSAEANNLAATNSELVQKMESTWISHRVPEPDFVNKTYDAK